MQPLSSPIERVWYRQFWPWFLIALPSVAVIACFISLGIAIRHGDSNVRDDYSKQGLVIQSSTTAADAAAQQQLGAALTIDADNHIALELRGRFAVQPPILNLDFIHPLDKQYDMSIELHNVGGARYQGVLTRRGGTRWRIDLHQPDQRWRLSATIALPVQQTLHTSL